MKHVALYSVICNYYMYKFYLTLFKNNIHYKISTSKLFLDFIKVICTLEFANKIFKIKKNSLRLNNLEIYEILCTKL